MDPATRAMYVFSDESLYEVGLRGEARDMWRVYLELQVGAMVVHCAQTEAQPCCLLQVTRLGPHTLTYFLKARV